MGRKKHLNSEAKTRCVKSYLRGENPETLSEIFGVTTRTIYNWVREYREYGTCDTVPVNDGRGRPPKISPTDAKKLLKIIKEPASKYGFENDLWNTERIRIVCKRELRINISKSGVLRFLHKFDHSFKKVQKRYYEVNAKEQDEWKEKVIPKIRKTVKKNRAILYFEDESSIQLSPVMGNSWGPVGEKTIHKATGKRGSIAAISSISNDGRLVFRLFDKEKRFNSDDIINFLKQMLKEHSRRHLVIVMDNAPCHKSKKTQEFINSQRRLHVFFLPPRSPEFNPDEQVWGYLKNHCLKSHKEDDTKGLKKLANKKLKVITRPLHENRGCDRMSIRI